MTRYNPLTFHDLDEDAVVRVILEVTATETGERFFAALAENLAMALNTHSAWVEETTHAIMDELEWPRENKKLTPAQRERAIDEVIELVAAVDGILQAQCTADVEYL